MCMRKTVVTVLVMALFVIPAFARQQPRTPKKVTRSLPALPVRAAEKRYPSLLWEISGNGLKKPSYLFGTMHVSDKLAFHLGDSFYNAIKSADVVALETNPETWQDDYSQSAFFGNQRRRGGLDGVYNLKGDQPDDHMRITTFAIDSYEEAMKAALSVEPSMINGLLYRSYGGQSDFEEDTFLDMYIFQTGKKLGKRVSGVEDFEASEKLVIEAYVDMMKDRNKKRRSYDYEGRLTNPKKVEDAYRKGDLDMLDSLEALTVFSDAFQEKFLYKRNEIQANSIDSIIKKSSLFVGVGAAHLPGERGVIEMLRKMGYKLRPVQMDDRNSAQKETIDKLRTSNTFVTQTSDDGLYTVAIPGKKFYRFTEWNGMDVVQYADMVNGAYYVVTRIKTNSLAWGHSTAMVYKKLDSLLYENIPGKILKKTPIAKNGYNGLDITSRTRRGDYQRYQLFVTPFELLVFKMSGTGEYINGGTDAQQFFNSIQLKEYPASNWQAWQPPTGGFTVQLPHIPSLLRDNNYGTDRLEYAARDLQDGNSYLVMKVNLHNYSFIEEDTFELNLVNESYGYSSFIEKELSRKFTRLQGYPALETKYKHKDGSFSAVKYIIRGPVYYAAIAHYKHENANVQKFMQSFAITPFIYPAVKQYTDTLLHITLQSPIYPVPDKKEMSITGLEDIIRIANEDEDGIADYSYFDADRFQSKVIGNDTIGEKIWITSVKLPKYSYEKDSAKIWKNLMGEGEWPDSTFVPVLKKQYSLPGGIRCSEMHVTDTGSSRLLLTKFLYKDGYFFCIAALTDTISGQSVFLKNVFSSLQPADSLQGESLFTSKTAQFFKDLFSKDSTVARKARKTLYQVTFTDADAPLLKAAIDSLNWKMRDYLDVKKYFIGKLGTLKDSTITPYLQQLYWKVKDTADWQHAILNALLKQKTKSAFLAFKDLIIQEPPIEAGEDTDYSDTRTVIFTSGGKYRTVSGRGYSGNWSILTDTLSLAKVIFPDFLQLLHVDDYREDVLSILTIMVDSGYIKAADYESYFSKMYLDAKQLLKKQVAKESREKIERLNRKGRSPSLFLIPDDMGADDEASDDGNEELDKYAILLLPFREKNPGIQNFFEQLLKTEDRQLYYNTCILLLRNNQPVPDSFFTKYAGLDQYRSDLYKDLKEIKKLDKFPVKYKTQLEIARSMLINSLNRYERMDTVIFIDKLPVAYEQKKGYVYFFKYKRMRDDAVWQLASVGMQPEKQTEVDVENDDFTNREERKLEVSKPVKEQLQKMLKEMIYSRRHSAAEFYDARSFSIYKSYLSEMVRSRRYRD
jgi:uncharacterized protein YbaP (TraB family)